MYIAVDFDGTVCTHAYPEIGDNIGAWQVLHELVDANHKIILYTMRSGKELQAAIDLFERYNVELYGINNNPTQHHWTNSPKAYAHVYIDDAAAGCPTISQPNGRKYVDWEAMRELLVKLELLND
jgi:hydroxymethylpyrimidine pyrophosphatase-like HAD family hydrolase